MMAAILADDANPGPLTSKKNVLMQQVYRGTVGQPVPSPSGRGSG